MSDPTPAAACCMCDEGSGPMVVFSINSEGLLQDFPEGESFPYYDMGVACSECEGHLKRVCRSYIATVPLIPSKPWEEQLPVASA